MKLAEGFSWPRQHRGDPAMRVTTIRAIRMAQDRDEEEETLAEATVSPEQLYSIKARKKDIGLGGATVDYDFGLSERSLEFPPYFCGASIYLGNHEKKNVARLFVVLPAP